jgi:hypothetical protein
LIDRDEDLSMFARFKAAADMAQEIFTMNEMEEYRGIQFLLKFGILTSSNRGCF